MIKNAFNTLEQSKWSLAALGYALRRLIDMEAAWVNDFQEFDDKITLGLSLGYTSNALQEITARICEQYTVEPEYVSRSNKVVAAFDTISAEKDFSKRKQFVIAVTQAAIDCSKAIKGNTNPLYDQPTSWALEVVINRLQEKQNIMSSRGWTEGAAIFPDIIALDGVPVKWDKASKRPELFLELPRPEKLKQDDQGIIKNSLDSHEGIKQFLHFILADIEVPATEICARNIVEYGADMPPQFTFDMARQASDEARHALMAEKMMARFDVKLGDYTHRDHVWKAYTRGESLAEKLAIEQILGEGNGLDSTVELISFYKAKGQDELVDYYEFLLGDETIHCAFGNIWMNYLLDGNEKEFNQVVDAAIKKSGISLPGKSPVDIKARLAAKFPTFFIEDRLAVKGVADYKKDMSFNIR